MQRACWAFPSAPCATSSPTMRPPALPCRRPAAASRATRQSETAGRSALAQPQARLEGAVDQRQAARGTRRHRVAETRRGVVAREDDVVAAALQKRGYEQLLVVAP